MTVNAAVQKPLAPHAFNVALASLAGTTIEWYDFYIFATASALVFGNLFFSPAPAVVGTMAAFATYLVAFIVRPFGAVLFGHLGDRLGRKTTLVATLFIMGAGTTLVGILPTYAVIGFWAPLLLLLLRVVQGLALGGEWGGAVLMAVEHASPRQRVFFGAFPQLGSSIGLLLASAAFLIPAGLMSPESFMEWGWRVPFLFSVVLLGIGLWIRLTIAESPLFAEVEKRAVKSSRPMVEVLTKSWRQVLLTIGIAVQSIGCFLVFTTFILSYGTANLGIPRQVLLNGQLITAAYMGVVLLFAAWLGMKFGAARIATVGAALTVVSAAPAFLLVLTKDPILVWLGMAVGQTGQIISYGVIATIIAAMFPTRYRYSGISIGYALSAMLGGTIPLLGTWLVSLAQGAWWPVAVVYTLMGMISLVCIVASRNHTTHMSGSGVVSDENEAFQRDLELSASGVRNDGAASSRDKVFVGE